jgi:predicted transcriptional regulator
MDLIEEDTILKHATSIVVAYVANNTIQKENLPALIRNTCNALVRIKQPEIVAEQLKPAVPIKRSVQPDLITCLEDGKQFKSLKRHLMTRYNMTPEEYREKWGLPPDYPMVAPNYAAARSEMAKKMGFGRREEPVATAKLSPKTAKKASAARRGRS